VVSYQVIKVLDGLFLSCTVFDDPKENGPAQAGIANQR
jgi:hypothetical protein